jgi:type IV pilus assembly protein PilP
MPQHVRYSAGLVVGLTLAVAGCSEDVIIQSPGPSSSPSAAAPVAPSSAAADVPPPVAFQEDDFLENDRSRDPFRSFQDLFLERSDRKSWQHAKVIRPDLPLDELRLIGVITGIVPAKAMVVDPAGKGHVIQRNDLVGKAERVQGGGGAGEFEINWRVDRIRESDVVFVREDPSNPDVPSATRVLSLRNEQEENAER